MVKRLLLLFLAFALWAGAAAETLALPTGTTEIMDGAFEGCGSIDEVVLPEGLRAVGDAAFLDCQSLDRVMLPSTLTQMGSDCFNGCGEALYLTCPPDSPAAQWARGSGFDYSVGNTCRALVIGQNYTGTDYVLYGPVNDARAMTFCLRRMETRPYAVTQHTNLTVGDILEAIDDAFSDSGTDDLSLLFFSGHGAEDGSLLGSDLELLSPSQLRSALDGIPGRKVVIVDACYSGALLDDGQAGVDGTVALTAAASKASGPAAFTQAFAASFARRSRSAFGDGGCYYVLTSAHADEESAESLISSGAISRIMGYFSYALWLGCGWDGIANTQVDMAADVNGDGAVTLQEAFVFSDDLASGFNENQSAVVYPEGCTAFAPFRR